MLFRFDERKIGSPLPSAPLVCSSCVPMTILRRVRYSLHELSELDSCRAGPPTSGERQVLSYGPNVKCARLKTCSKWVGVNCNHVRTDRHNANEVM